MNTKANKAITSTFFVDPENGWNQVKEAWKSVKNPTFLDHIIYLMLRGKDWTKSITPITNSSKKSNGQMPWNWTPYLTLRMVYLRTTALLENGWLKGIVVPGVEDLMCDHYGMPGDLIDTALALGKVKV